MKKTLSMLTMIALTLTLCLSISFAQEKGDAELILRSTIDTAKKPKLVFFPHKEHQEKFECATCHHGKSADGKQISYVEGQKIEKCESCHNTQSGINSTVDTFKKAGHARCKKCHKELKKAGKEAGPTKCKGCHRKGLK